MDCLKLLIVQIVVHDSDDDNDSSDNDTSGNNKNDDDELDVVEFGNEGREINENPTLNSNESNKNKKIKVK